MSRFKRILAVFSIVLVPHSLYSQNKEVISLDVQPTSRQVVIIQWNLLPASDTLPLEVERSRDTINWQRISHMAIQSSHQYFITDSMPGDGLIYYRIKQVNNKSNSKYSSIKWVQISKTGNLYIWANPAKDLLHIRTPLSRAAWKSLMRKGNLCKK
jgi:hypothetical protein